MNSNAVIQMYVEETESYTLLLMRQIHLHRIETTMAMKIVAHSRYKPTNIHVYGRGFTTVVVSDTSGHVVSNHTWLVIKTVKKNRYHCSLRNLTKLRVVWLVCEKLFSKNTWFILTPQRRQQCLSSIRILCYFHPCSTLENSTDFLLLCCLLADKRPINV